MLGVNAKLRIGVVALCLIVGLTTSSRTSADIIRWDNREAIPGTEGITPGPGIQLNDRQLEYADFGVDLTNANLAYSNLSGARFLFSTVSGADFTGAIVTGARFNSVTSFTKEQLYSTASYQRKNMRGIGLGAYLIFDRLGPSNDLTAWDLSGQDLTNASFYQSTLIDTDFVGAIVAGTSFSGTTDAGFTKEQLYATASYEQQNLPGIGLSYNNLAGWDFSGHDLTNARFDNSTLANADLSGAHLVNAFLPGATLTGANLTGADLRGANGINITEAISRNAIRPDGAISGLKLDGDGELAVRDYDGDSRYSPARLPIPITVREQFAMSDGGVLRLVLESDPWDSVIAFEPDIPVQLGGTLELTFADDTNMPQIGRTLRIFDWTGVAPTGTFAVASPYTWDVSRLYTTGEVTLLSIPEPTSLLSVLIVVAVAATRRAGKCVKTR